MITIVDYGMGNLGSIANMFKKIGAQAEITSDLEKINKAQKLLLPGVGAFDNAMHKINSAGMLPVLNTKVLNEKVPVLGICLGMQLLTNSSEEGQLPGLGWISGKTLSFKKVMNDDKLKIPHMGWSSVKKATSSPLTENFYDDTRFYFVHSYYVKADSRDNVILTTNYFIDFDSALQKDNIFGAQFHPEKSHKFGMRFLENFAKI
ncbi:MAG: imidazole glycerol phosphate synthase subunit HisH [Bacteroidetes bacterium]|nr:imidazole glycerol phosphate synthase subunit HisH [Bacteroidota bacterium]